MDTKLLTILACPLCKGDLKLQRQPQELLCRFDRLAFPIKDEIPILLESDAREISLEELDNLT